jgi:Xaa-Pro aminopeptidase
MPRQLLHRLYLVSCFVVLLSTCAAFGLERQDAGVYHARRVALSQKTNGGVIVLFAPVERADEIFGFHQDSNFYYLTGWTEPGAALIIAPAAEARTDQRGSTPARAYSEILFLPARNLLEEKWLGPKLGPGDAEVTRLTGFEKVEVLDKMHDELAALASTARSGIYSDLGGYNEESASVEPLAWLRRGQSFGGFFGFQDVKKQIGELRIKKDPGELDLIVKATRASMAGHPALPARHR